MMPLGQLNRPKQVPLAEQLKPWLAEDELEIDFQRLIPVEREKSFEEDDVRKPKAIGHSRHCAITFPKLQ